MTVCLLSIYITLCDENVFIMLMFIHLSVPSVHLLLDLHPQSLFSRAAAAARHLAATVVRLCFKMCLSINQNPLQCYINIYCFMFYCFPNSVPRSKYLINVINDHFRRAVVRQQAGLALSSSYIRPHLQHCRG